jgi:hypothetical protein
MENGASRAAFERTADSKFDAVLADANQRGHAQIDPRASFYTLFPYASTFTILQDHCHRYYCLQPSQAPGITTDTSSNNTTLQPLAQVNTHQNNDKSTQRIIRFLSFSRIHYLSNDFL